MDKDRKISRLLLVVIILISLAILTVIGLLVYYGLKYKADRDANDKIKKIAYDTLSDPGKSVINLEGLKEINADTVAWLDACGGEVSGPVVSSTDDDYYLHHRFDKEEAGCGAFFTDRFTSPAFKGPLTIVYGHNMNDGSMFHKLLDLKDEDYLRSHSTFTVYTENGAEEYKIFSVFFADFYDIPWIAQRSIKDSESEKQCLNVTGRGGLETADFIKNVSERSLIGIDLSEYKGREQEGKIAILCTCENINANKRFVVYGIHV